MKPDNKNRRGAGDAHSPEMPAANHPNQPVSRRRLAESTLYQTQPMPDVHHIELNLRDINQLFNTMDPSPFHEKDLDHDAEEFILSWAEEFHRQEPVDLIVHLETLPEEHDAKQLVENAVHNYFAYRTRLNRLELKRLMKQGRMSLLVGLSFLGICLLIIELLVLNRPGTLPNFLTQSLTIAGWVAMWRPMEIYLYDWWPLRRRGKIFDKLSRMPIEVRKRV
jgi:hypothetical protein